MTAHPRRGALDGPVRSRTSAYPVFPLRHLQAVHAALPEVEMLPATGHLADRRGRPLSDLRISVTDRCNFRCGYCMPQDAFGSDHVYLAQDALLTFAEIVRLARIFAAHGVRKIRLTGGEPLLRKNLAQLVRLLAALRTADDAPMGLAMTTNGALLARKAVELRAGGLQRVTVSLDALDDAVFRRMNGVGFAVRDVLAGIDAAVVAGLGPVKVNMVVQRGVNDQEILPMARYFRNHFGGQVILRFIEYMDVGTTNGWRLHDVVSSAEVVGRLAAAWPLVPLEPTAPGETAQRWAYADGAGEIGVISSVTRSFCGDCSRARLSTDGKVYTCLFAGSGHDLKSPLRAGASDVHMEAQLAALWGGRSDRYSELRAGRPDGVVGPARAEMNYLGG